MSKSLRFVAIRASNPILDYCCRHEIRLRRAGTVWVGKCPIHREKHGESFSVDPRSGRWHCFGKCQTGGDVVDLDRLLNGDELVDALRRLGVATLSAGMPRTERASGSKANPRRWAGQLRAGSSDELHITAVDRNLAVEAAELTQARGLLRYWDSDEGVAWVITDSTRANAIGRLLNRKPWRGGFKAKNLLGSAAKRPIGLREASSHERIALVEGGPDTISAFHHALVDASHETLGVICMPSSNADFRPEDVEFVAGRRIRIFPHCDKAGFKAALRWIDQLKGTASVTWFDFDGLTRTDGKPVGDLNDLASVDYDSWEIHREAIEGCMIF